ncbi:MAG: hypothetical protein JWO19_4488 [Bryobacterales bacterium]|nr:hypothetical protein [Bryobacterales bacterium]
MPENGITVHHRGKERFLEMDEQDADNFYYFAGLAEDVPMTTGGKRPEEDIERRTRLRKIHTEQNTLGNVTRNLVELDANKLALVSALIDLLNAGENSHQSGGNWVYEVVQNLLYEVTMEGPFACNDGDPRQELGAIAHSIATFWDYVDDAYNMKEQHPKLFPAPPAEPETSPEPAITSKPAKRQRARKRHGKTA